MDSLADDLLAALPKEVPALPPPSVVMLTHDIAFENQQPPTTANPRTHSTPVGADPIHKETTGKPVACSEPFIKQRPQIYQSQRHPKISAPRNKTATRISAPAAVNKKKRKPHAPMKKRLPTYNEHDRKHIWKMLHKQVVGKEVKRFIQETKGWESGHKDKELSEWVKTLKKGRKKIQLQRVRMWAKVQQDAAGKQNEQGPQTLQHPDLGEPDQVNGDCLSVRGESIQMMPGLPVDGGQHYVDMMKGLNIC